MPIDREMDKEDVVHVYNGILFSRQKAIRTLVTTWIDLEGIMLSEISQTEKDEYCMISLIRGILKK